MGVRAYQRGGTEGAIDGRLGSQRERYANAAEVQAYSGIAPVTEQSGKKKWVHFRWACPKFLRQSFHEWAGHSIAHSQWARSYYQ
jgi:transposase